MCGGGGAVTLIGGFAGYSGQRDRARMEQQRLAGRPTVNRVADNRTAESGAMHADLMGAAGPRTQLEPGPAVADPENAVIGHGMLPGRVDDYMPPFALGELSERGFNPALVKRRAAFDHRPIDFLDLSVGEQRAEAPQRLGMAAQYETAAGVAIEPMGESRGVRQSKAQRVKTAFKIGAATGPGMHRDSRRFVDDKDQPVAIKHAIGKRGADAAPHLNPLSAARGEGGTRVGGGACPGRDPRVRGPLGSFAH